MRLSAEQKQGRLRNEDWFIADASIAKSRNIVVNHHYAQGAANTATTLHGLYRRVDMELCGVAWWIPPTRSAANAFWADPEEVLCLSRLVVIPDTPRNAASFLLMNSVKMIDKRWRCLVTYADKWRGHTVEIYRTCGWEYMGESKPERTYILNDRMVARKAGQHTRTHAEMMAMGASMVGAFSKHRFRLIRKPSRHVEIVNNQMELIDQHGPATTPPQAA